MHVDHHKRRISITAHGDFSGLVISKASAALLLNQPRTASYDFVMDVRHSTTGSTVSDFQIVLEAYRKAPRTPGVKYGCYVSHETGYIYWAQAMGELFGDRTCLVFPTPADAHAFLDEKRLASPA